MHNASKISFQMTTDHCAQKPFTRCIHTVLHYALLGTECAVLNFTCHFLLQLLSSARLSAAIIGAQFRSIHLEKFCVNYYFALFSSSSLMH